MEGKKLLITGSRSITDKKLVFDALDKLEGKPSVLIHGGATGVDTLAGEWAKSKGIEVNVVRPDWKKFPITQYRFKAYAMRDRLMVDTSDVVVAIWDGVSSGTQLTFTYADTKGKLSHVITI